MGNNLSTASEVCSYVDALHRWQQQIPLQLTSELQRHSLMFTGCSVAYQLTKSRPAVNAPSGPLQVYAGRVWSGKILRLLK